MRIITYLAFTLLSILVQFCVMDFIKEKLRKDEKPVSNLTSQRKRLSDVVREISPKPYALYYRTEENKLFNKSSGKMYSNASLPVITSTTTDISTTMFEVYDEDDNVSGTDSSPTTEIINTETDNTTEISLYGNKNQTTTKFNDLKPNISISKDCSCNFLYKVCDINCCCDTDCSKDDIKMFYKCIQGKKVENVDINYCYTDNPMDRKKETSFIDNLFCIVKTNLPEKRFRSSRKEKNIPFQAYLWQDINLPDKKREFVKKSYEFNDPLWFYKNSSIYYMDLPSPGIHSYCTGRKAVHFLIEENIICVVKLKDLEMFRIVKLIEGMIISVTDQSMNKSELNCSNLHCVNWTIIACDSVSCLNYNKTIHEPFCTESMCKNLAPRVEYVFYYYNSKIMNATMILHTQELSIAQQYIQQNINVKFVLANESTDKIIEFSGSPGYESGLPVIVSFANSNYTERFFNNSSEERHLAYPDNINGQCIFTNTTRKLVLFRHNKRIKCRYTHNVKTENNAELCKSVQNNISKLLGFHKKVVVSPHGNPYGIKDKDWLLMPIDLSEKDIVYGQFDNKSSRFNCYNLITRISLIFTFDDIIDGKTGQNRILYVKTDTTTRNISFNVDDISTVITVDVSFLDGSKPSVSEYAGSLHLNIHLPEGFFFPFPSNKSHFSYYNLYCVILCFMFLVCE